MSWSVESLSSLASGGLFCDGDWVESKDQDPEGDVRLTQLADVGVGVFRDRSDRRLREDQASRLNCTFLQPDDILIARMPDPIGRACLVPPGIGRAVTVVDVAVLRLARPDLDPRFVMWAINSPAPRRLIESMQSGTTRKRVSRRNLSTVTIALPELAEQRRIVDILEDHLSRLDAANSSIARAEAQLTTLAESALRATLGSVDTEEVLLERILAVPLSNGRSVPTSDLGFPVLRLTALRSGRIDLNERKVGGWSRADALPFLVAADDFLVARGNGSLSLVGRGGLVREPVDEVAFPDTMIRVRPDPSVASPSFFALVWNSRDTRRQIEAMARTTAGIYKVNQKQLGGVRLSLPSLADQEAVVRRVSAVQDGLGRLASETIGARNRAASLRRALLAAAFSGKLTGAASDSDRIEELATTT